MIEIYNESIEDLVGRLVILLLLNLFLLLRSVLISTEFQLRGTRPCRIQLALSPGWSFSVVLWPLHAAFFLTTLRATTFALFTLDTTSSFAVPVYVPWLLCQRWMDVAQRLSVCLSGTKIEPNETQRKQRTCPLKLDEWEGITSTTTTTTAMNCSSFQCFERSLVRCPPAFLTISIDRVDWPCRFHEVHQRA